jgi:hypothetical protein
MTREQLDTEVFDGSIDSGSSETFEVDTARAENIIILASTSRSYTDSAWGSHMEVEIENTTASSANYRITIKSYRKLD